MSTVLARGADATDEFHVRVPVFEGPLQLLLHLVESRELDLLTIPLADVADAYVAHLSEHTVEARNLAEFVSIAAQLILLKSRRLLPEDPLPPPGADDDVVDEDDLRRRLMEYRAIRHAADRLGALDLARPAFRREPRESDLPLVDPEPISARVLWTAMRALLATRDPEPPAPEVLEREVTIAEQIRALRAAMGRRGRTVLQDVLARCRSRTEAAVTVLAMLELVRRRQVRIDQRELFGPITIALVDEAP